MKGWFIVVSLLVCSYVHAVEPVKGVDYKQYLAISEINKIDIASKEIIETVNKLEIYDFTLEYKDVYDSLINVMIYYRAQQIEDGVILTGFQTSKLIEVMKNSFMSSYILTDQDRSNINFYTDDLCTVIKNCEDFQKHFHSYLTMAVTSRKSKKVLANIVDDDTVGDIPEETMEGFVGLYLASLRLK